ncbi:MAG: hypothetical protein WCA44_04400 [Acidobacteriaceae bacterium]
MKYDALQQAAVEASSELRKIVAELDQLEARRIGLQARREALNSIGRQLMTVMSMISAEAPTDEPVTVASAPELPASEPTIQAAALPEPEPEPFPEEEAPALAPADNAADRPAVKWPSFADLLAQGKPSTLRDEGWRAVPPATHLELRALVRAAD